MTGPRPPEGELAQRIVDDVLAAVDQFGRFEGRGKERALTFPLIVKRDSDETADVCDRMVAHVNVQLEPYRDVIRALWRVAPLDAPITSNPELLGVIRECIPSLRAPEEPRNG